MEGNQANTPIDPATKKAFEQISKREKAVEKREAKLSVGEAEAKRIAQAKIETKGKNFAVIRISGAGGKGELNYVHVGADDGKGGHRQLTIMKNEYVPLEKRFVDSLKHATVPIMEPDDGTGDQLRRRKIVSRAPRFPFELVAWITKAAYSKMRKHVLPQYQGGKGLSLTEELVYEMMD
ncbi:hypothetical protein LCGC14_0384490 [marine sediment metagenome]|uniref:Uncharacterized protein n=1 Tax=marine sediment metagenome TaxID=412755 RepID=A0A0F9T1B5_9ZZZZ